MTRSELIEKVATVLDEINPLEQGETIANQQIDKQLDGAADSLVRMLPSSIAFPETGTPTVRNFIADFSVELECPADFVRLHRLKLKDWIRSISSLSPDGDQLLLKQDYKYVKSTFRRPMASIHNEDGTDIITCYPPPEESGDEVVEFLYVKKPSNAQSINTELMDMLAWHCAGIVYSVSGQSEHAELCRNRLAAMIETRIKHG